MSTVTCFAGGTNGTCTACPDNLMTNKEGADSQDWCSEYILWLIAAWCNM
jgi:hypothetical protein